MELHLKAQLTAEDYAAAEQLHMGRVPELVFFGAIAMAVLVGLFASGLIQSPTEWSGVLLILLFTAWTIRRSLRRGIGARTGKQFVMHKAIQLPYEIDLSDVEIITRSAERGEWKAPWTDFCKWKAGPDLVIIYPAPRLYHIFPRRWFDADADFAAFQALLTRTLGPAGKLRKIV